MLRKLYHKEHKDEAFLRVLPNWHTTPTYHIYSGIIPPTSITFATHEELPRGLPMHSEPLGDHSSSRPRPAVPCPPPPIYCQGLAGLHYWATEAPLAPHEHLSCASLSYTCGLCDGSSIGK